MEDQGFNSSPQSSMEQEGKRSADLAKNEASRTGDQVEETAEQMRDQSAESAQSWRELVQSKVQPIVNHPYVRKSSEILNSGATQMKPLVGRTTETISSKFQPVVGKATETLQLGRDTAKKIYNKEEGYEPSKVAPYFAGSLGVLLLCMLLAGWSASDGRSKYNVDVSKIFADKVKLTNGRHIAYVEHGASREEAKINVLFVHGLLSSRLLGLQGVNENLLRKYSVRLVSYDRPGIGQSDPHLKRTLNSSSEDMADFADALGMGDKFWVFAHSGGAAYAWAALHYIPNRLAGVAMLGPLMNPYAKNTTTEESKGMWAGLGPMKPTFQYARHFPAFVPGKLKNNVKKVNKYMKNTKKRVNAKDRDLLETDAFGEAWERAIRESVRSGDLKPHAQDIILQARDWGFKLSDIGSKPKKSFFKRILFFLGSSNLPGFFGPIHIFHGTEDKIVPLVMSEYVKRVLPQVELHKLEGEGHYSWYFNCDHCHRELFKTLFGEVAGLEELDNSVKPEHNAEKEPEKIENYEVPAENVKPEEKVKAEENEKPAAELESPQREAERLDLFKEAGKIAPEDEQVGLSQEGKVQDEL
ncbi:uncharacterized protein [Physcomitrium patens]|uniref:AB hydrolase-1 domain-containing protein n=1 Tax=Physcomitrium patens TaxID=3218 RepID=A9RWR3_PHYPA|nr:uncharacterized protein LOC112295403 [Physcomitrium patens]PNR35514.1 hypothetical protein PHYPA_023414 [Physcomitrium patens]|eukprot:XP_024402705.1 uncharacterized protein LOC112295403 [Physcomitrella patens]